jgi:hypothetical protein
MTNRKLDALTVAGVLFNVQLSEAVVLAYDMACNTLTDEQFERAVYVTMQTSKFLPKPVDIIEAAGVAPPSVEYKWRAAWMTVVHAVAVRRPSFVSPIAQAIIAQMGGYEVLSAAHSYNLQEFHTWKRKEFFDIYADMALSDPQNVSELESLPIPAKRLQRPDDPDYDLLALSTKVAPLPKPRIVEKKPPGPLSLSRPSPVEVKVELKKIATPEELLEIVSANRKRLHEALSPAKKQEAKL